MNCEKHFNVVITDDELESIKTVKNLVEIVIKNT